jgi:uncharacterized protein
MFDMRRFMIALLAASGLAFPASAQPAPAPPQPTATQAAPTCTGRRVDADPALWVVRDADTTIYLFGTFHLLDPCRDWFNDDIRAAFDRSQELVIEADIPENPAELQPIILRYAVDQDGNSLEGLSEAQRRRLGELLGPMGIPNEALDRLDPWMINVTLAQIGAQELGLTAESGAEAVLKRAARSRNMPIGTLETAEFQIRMLDGQDREEQLESLRETLDDLGRMRAVLEPMLRHWSSGNAERFADVLNENIADDPQSYRVLLIDRNATWARWIQDRLTRPGTVFMAVGAGHLGGVGSVQDQLRWLGIPSQRVRGGRI